MNLELRKLIEPSAEIAEYFNRWENDPRLTHLIRVHRDQASLDKVITVTKKDLAEWLARKQIYLIYLENQLVGEVEFQVDPKHLYIKGINSAWVAILIGEEAARGKGIGYRALQFLENEVRQLDLRRMELGVFEFNTNAIKLYERLGFQEIGRIPDFTYWQGKRWADIRMEKHI